MKRTRLNLAALRGTPRLRSTDAKPTLSEVLSTPSAVSLSRRELLGLAGVAAVSVPPMVKEVGPALLGRFELARQPGRVAFKLGGRERWVIDRQRLAGEARLEVEENNDFIRVTLTGARYPGTQLPADFVCQLRRGLAGWRMRLQLKLGGLRGEVPLASWLAGAEPIRGRVRLSRLACPLADGAGLTLSGAGEAEFSPDWRLKLCGCEIASLTGLGKAVVSDTITVALLQPDAPSIIEEPPARRSLVVLEREEHEWALVESLSAPGEGKFTAEGCPFDTIQIEAGEDERGRAQRTLLAEGDGQAARLSYLPSEQCPRGDGQAFALPLREPRYAVAWSPGGNETALVANFSDTPVWLHGEGCSVQLGDVPDCRPFEVVSEGGQIREARCEPALLAVFAPLAGAMVELSAAPEGAQVHFVSSDTQVAQIQRRQPPAGRIERPPAVQVPPAGEVRPVPGLQLPGIRLLGLTVNVVRPEDLLALSFEFRNLSLETGNGEAPQLVRVQSQEPAYIIVHFPPQHIAEQAFFEVDNNLPVGNAYRPAGVEPDADASASGSEPLPPPPVRARLSGPSRLVFELPEGVNSIDYSLSALLDWTKYKLSVAPTALPPPTPVQLRPLQTPGGLRFKVSKPGQRLTTEGSQPRLPAQLELLVPSTTFSAAALARVVRIIREPTATETAIEAPYRLMLSPSSMAGWAHTDKLVEHNGRVELWHTRLGVSSGEERVVDRQYEYGWKDGTFRVLRTSGGDQLAYFRSLRAVWSPDYSKSIPTHVNTPFRMSLDRRDRCELVWLTSDFSIAEAQSRVVHADRLMLSPLGVWIDSKYAAEVPLGHGLSVEAWRHQATMGRDQYVKVVYKGYLFPFGHRASLIKVTERKFHTGRTGTIAYLRQRMFIVVREPEKTYPAFGQANDGRAIPFRRVRITSLVTPNLNPPESSAVPGTGASAQAAFWPRVGSEDFPFQIVAEDWDGQRSDFSVPLIFIGVENAPGKKFGFAFDEDTMGHVVTYYNEQAEESRRQSGMFGQKVAFADSSAQKPGDTSLETQTVIFGAEMTAPDNAVSAKTLEENNQPRCYPTLARAEVRMPAVAQVTGSAASTAIQIHPTYINDAWHSARNKGEVFIGLLDSLPLQFGADQSGGLATPDLNIQGLSRKFGPVGGVLEDLAGGTFDPTEFFSDTAKILGSILLRDIIKAVFGDDQIPKLTSHVERDDNGAPEAVVAKLEWAPDVQSFPSFGKPIFAADNGTSLSISATLRSDLSGQDATAQVEGKLTRFALHLIPFGSIDYFIRIAFDEISFLSKTGQKLDVSAEIGEIEFGGPLKFVNTLSKFIPMDGFSDPPNLDISPTGIKLGYTLPIPSVAVGVFSLQNISLIAGFELPFTSNPLRLRFGFCERHNPFLLTVSMFGGGGFFAIELTPQGLSLLEASFEFGGSLSLDIGVASGGIYAMGGVYYKWEDGEAVLTGYLRMGGSLSILGIITISLEFYLGLTYESAGNRVWGEASLKVSIEILFFSISVTLRVKRQFAGSSEGHARLDGLRLAQLGGAAGGLVPATSPPSFEDLMAEADWIAYCEAFA